MEQFRPISTGRAVTLREVAVAAGVSSSAASVVLNGSRSGTRVSDSTHRAVLEVATRMGYRPHRLAQSLATGRTGRIGFYSGHARLNGQNNFIAEVLGGVFDAAESYRLDTIVHTSGSEPARIVDLLRSHAVDGLILHTGPDDPILPWLGDLRVPAIAIGDPIEGMPTVAVDDAEGGTLLARHLASRGHRHILVKHSPLPPRSALTRIGAFRETCARLGIVTTMGTEGGEALSDSDLRLLTEGDDRATAVMGWSDAMADWICRRLADVGLSVPDLVAVVGFDGLTVPFAPRFELTTIRAPWGDVGREAARHLNRLIDGEPVPVLTLLPVAFQQGATT